MSSFGGFWVHELSLNQMKNDVVQTSKDHWSSVEDIKCHGYIFQSEITGKNNKDRITPLIEDSDKLPLYLVYTLQG